MGSIPTGRSVTAPNNRGFTNLLSGDSAALWKQTSRFDSDTLHLPAFRGVNGFARVTRAVTIQDVDQVEWSGRSERPERRFDSCRLDWFEWGVL